MSATYFPCFTGVFSLTFKKKRKDIVFVLRLRTSRNIMRGKMEEMKTKLKE